MEKEKNKEAYEAPLIEMVETPVEQGFQTTPPSPGPPGGGGGSDDTW